MNLLAAELELKIARHLSSNRFQLSPEHAKLWSQVDKVAIEKIIAAEFGRALTNKENGWYLALQEFWSAVPTIPKLVQSSHRLAINPSSIMIREMQETTANLRCFSLGNSAGKVCETLRLAGGKNEDNQTYHVDDLVLFALNGYEDPHDVVDLACTLIPGSTVTTYFPTEAFRPFLDFFGLQPVDLLLDALATQYKVNKLHEDVGSHWYTQVFGLEPKE